jgi:hydroxymethylpyrimidine pyrophosphatase-like HAD family hydrolase
MIIAVDFDGTLVEHCYPEIGREKLFAFEALKDLQKQNHQLILWTIRTGNELEEAVQFCRERGIEFYAVNKSYPEEVLDPETTSRKIQADVYIDDRNVGGLLGWGEIWHILNPHDRHHFYKELNTHPLKRGFIRRFCKMIISK